MITKKNLTSLIETLVNINAVLTSDIEAYKREAETADRTIRKLRQELKIARRNEPIWTADRFEMNNLKETIASLKCENEGYKALTDNLRAEVTQLTAKLKDLERKGAKK